ncbi:MAG TPA: DciA family protein [Elusimicrobiales bacterium]|nr:DciA family protein [Elusimicrobiales bacterium]
MFLKKRSSNWSKAGEICAAHKFLGGIFPERLAILEAVWKKEFGRLSQHCVLLGVDGDSLLVKPSSSAAASELTLRGPVIVKGINKYFRRPWIKAIKTASKI